jgi:hypothetical protein
VSPVVAQGQSTFTTGDERHDVLFAVSVPNVESSPDDLYFHIAGPSDSSWIGKKQAFVHHVSFLTAV